MGELSSAAIPGGAPSSGEGLGACRPEAWCVRPPFTRICRFIPV